MPRRAATSAILLTVPFALACATPEERAERLIAHVDLGSDGLEAATARLIQDEFAAVAANCELPAARLTRIGEVYRLNLPAAVHAARDRPPAAGRIACIMRWARDAELTLTLAQAPE